MSDFFIRQICEEDNPLLATIIRNTLAEFGANHPGTVYYDESTDHLFDLFQKKGSMYFVAVLNDEVVGGAGIYPSDGLAQGTVELVKMYLLPQARKLGIGKKLIEKCIEHAKSSGYTNMYLETMPELRKAIGIYEKFGFEYLKGPMGNTGHFGCYIWMLRKL